MHACVYACPVFTLSVLWGCWHGWCPVCVCAVGVHAWRLQLYDRDCRRRFCSVGHWEWPTLNLQANDAVVSSLSGGAIETNIHSGSLPLHTARTVLVLGSIPQVVPFDDRVAIFQVLLETMKRDRAPYGGLKVKVRRDHIFEDTLNAFDRLCSKHGATAALRSRIQVTFVNEHGLEEAGIDGGGLFKEFMDTISKRAFDIEVGGRGCEGLSTPRAPVADGCVLLLACLAVRPVVADTRWAVVPQPCVRDRRPALVVPVHGPPAWQGRLRGRTGACHVSHQGYVAVSSMSAHHTCLLVCVCVCVCVAGPGFGWPDFVRILFA